MKFEMRNTFIHEHVYAGIDIYAEYWHWGQRGGWLVVQAKNGAWWVVKGWLFRSDVDVEHDRAGPYETLETAAVVARLHNASEGT